MNFKREEGGHVTFTLEEDTFDLLLTFLGRVAGDAMQCGDILLAKRVLNLANEINAGNPLLAYRCRGCGLEFRAAEGHDFAACVYLSDLRARKADA